MLPFGPRAPAANARVAVDPIGDIACVHQEVARVFRVPREPIPRVQVGFSLIAIPACGDPVSVAMENHPLPEEVCLSTRRAEKSPGGSASRNDVVQRPGFRRSAVDAPAGPGLSAFAGCLHSQDGRRVRGFERSRTAGRAARRKAYGVRRASTSLRRPIRAMHRPGPGSRTETPNMSRIVARGSPAPMIPRS